MADPQFDPSKPYSVIGSDTSAMPSGPTFDPSKPFEPVSFGSDEYIKSMAAKHGVDEDTVRSAAHAQYSGHVLSGVAGTVGLGSLVPKAGAAISAAAAPLTGKGAQAPTFGQRYSKERDLEEELARDYEQENPALSTASELGGAALTGTGLVRAGAGPLIGAVEGGLGRQMGIGAATNAAYGALDSYLRGQDPASGATMGAGVGALAPAVGRTLGNAVTGARNLWRGATPPAVPGNTTRIAGQDFALSGGEATGDIGAQRLEQAAARGAVGPEAQQAAEGFFGRPNDPNVPGIRGQQREAVEDAITRSFDQGGQVRAGSPYDAGQSVIDATRQGFNSSRSAYNQAYGRAAQIPGDIHAPFFNGITDRIQQDLTNRAQPVIIDNRTTPVATALLDHINNTIAQLRIQNRAMPGGQPNPNSIVGINMHGVEQIRKQLVSMGRSATYANPADQRAVSAVKQAFDDQIFSAIQQRLFTGQADQALDALRQARQAYATHASLYSPQPNDQGVGKMIQQIVGTNGYAGANPQEVANWVYAQSQIGGSAGAARLVERLGDVIGRNTEAWAALKQGLFSRLIENPPGAAAKGTQAIANRIAQFLGGHLSQTLFTPQERTLMASYGRLMQQITPLPGAVNYSGTAYALPVMARHALSGILGAIGAGMHGPLGYMAYHAAGHGAQAAGELLRQRSTAGRVTRSIYQTPAQQRAEAQLAERWGRHGATIGAAVRAGIHPVAATAGRQASDGQHYLPDPARPGSYLRVDDRRGAAQ